MRKGWRTAGFRPELWRSVGMWFLQKDFAARDAGAPSPFAKSSERAHAAAPASSSGGVPRCETRADVGGSRNSAEISEETFVTAARVQRNGDSLCATRGRE